MRKHILNLTFSEKECREIRTGRVELDPANGLDLRVPVAVGTKRVGDEEPPMKREKKREKIETLRIFTDGSCVNNGKKNSVGGIGIHFPDHQVTDVSLPYRGYVPLVDSRSGQELCPPNHRGKVTNQRAELTAILVAITLAHEYFQSLSANFEKSSRMVDLYTDSEYCINSLTNWCYTWKAKDWKTANGKPVKNRDLIEPILALLKKQRVTFFHSVAHTNGQDERSVGNARADSLATQATRSQLKKK
uniref:ribonuclease H n=1 Tax=viral metagenome TaxID=1070528 RepID=A0A6C0BPX9_9ZZZZ